MPEDPDALVRRETALRKTAVEPRKIRISDDGAKKRSTQKKGDYNTTQKRETQSAATCWQSQAGVQATTSRWQSREELRQKVSEADSGTSRWTEKQRDRRFRACRPGTAWALLTVTSDVQKESNRKSAQSRSGCQRPGTKRPKRRLLDLPDTTAPPV